MADELRLDEFGEDQLRRWAFHDNPTAEQWLIVGNVLAGLAVKRPYRELGAVEVDPVTGDVAITSLEDPRVTVIVIRWAGDAETFSLRYVGNVDDLCGRG